MDMNRISNQHFLPSSTNHSLHPEMNHDPACPRCGGLLAKEYCFDIRDGTGENGFWALRCFQCGEVIDPIILHNRNSEPPPKYKKGARFKPAFVTLRT